MIVLLGYGIKVEWIIQHENSRRGYRRLCQERAPLPDHPNELLRQRSLKSSGWYVAAGLRYSSTVILSVVLNIPSCSLHSDLIVHRHIQRLDLLPGRMAGLQFCVVPIPHSRPLSQAMSFAAFRRSSWTCSTCLLIEITSPQPIS